jgi:hypothetical protein
MELILDSDNIYKTEITSPMIYVLREHGICVDSLIKIDRYWTGALSRMSFTHDLDIPIKVKYHKQTGTYEIINGRHRVVKKLIQIMKE